MFKKKAWEESHAGHKAFLCTILFLDGRIHQTVWKDMSSYDEFRGKSHLGGTQKGRGDLWDFHVRAYIV